MKIYIFNFSVDDIAHKVVIPSEKKKKQNLCSSDF